MKKLALLLALCLVFSTPLAQARSFFGNPVQVDNTTIEKNSTNQIRVKDSGISTAKIANQAATASKVSAIVGADVAKSDNTVYQAETDGEFCGVITCGTSSINVGKIEVYTDASNPPTTLKTGANCSVHADSVSQTSTGNVGGFCVSIRKNDYYKGVLSSIASGGGSTGASATYTFTPLGS
jgi:hypothetical protein